MTKLLSDSEIINEYKKYIENNVLNNSFDFSTWCHHQFGEAPSEFSIETKLDFDMVSKTPHK